MELDLNGTIQAEKSLLGCIMLSGSIMDNISSKLSSVDFLDHNHLEIYTAIDKLHKSGEVIDLVSVAQNMPTDLKVYCMELHGNVNSSANYDYYLTLVKNYSTKRKLYDIASVLSMKSLDESALPDILIREVEKSLARLEVTDDQVLNTSDIVDEVIENIKHLRTNPQDVTGMSTGFDTLDKKTSGLHKSDLIILAARPACGKSALALQIARNVAIYSKGSVMFFSLEMGADQLIRRLVSAESRVDLGLMQSGKINDIQLKSIENSADLIKSLPLYFNDKAGISIQDIRAQIKLHNSKNPKLNLIIIDYLQLMAIGAGSNTVQQVTEISRGLKIIAKEFNVPVIALSQLSRGVEQRGGKPRLSDLRDSGSIEQDADIVMFLHRETNDEDAYGSKTIELMIAKHRNGALAEIPMNFNGSKMTFTEVDPTFII